MLFIRNQKKNVSLHFKQNKTMQAFIPAAGLGTRLRPLTDHRPKAMIEIDGVPLLKIAIDNLIRQGISRIVVNVHHFPDMIIDYIVSHTWEVPISISDERDLLLDTGGGLKKASSFMADDEPVLIHNVDVLSTIDLNQLLSLHKEKNDLATLAVSERKTSRYLLFDQRDKLTGWANTTSGETKWVSAPATQCKQFAFSGIAIVEPTFLSQMPVADKPYPIIPVYLEMAKSNRISYFQHSSNAWFDVGTPQKLDAAKQWYHSLQK